MENKVRKLKSRANNANIVVRHLYQHPILDAQKTKDLTGLSSPSVYKLLEELENLDILQEMTGAKRGKVFFFQDYINLFQ